MKTRVAERAPPFQLGNRSRHLVERTVMSRQTGLTRVFMAHNAYVRKCIIGYAQGGLRGLVECTP